MDFELDADQKRLRNETRELAHEVLDGVADIARSQASAEERFAATRPHYGRLVEAGLLRKVIPTAAGGEATRHVDVAIIAEELMAVDANVALTLLATSLGVAPIVHCGSESQQRDLLAPFLNATGTPLAAFGMTEPSGQANFDAPLPGGLSTTATESTDGWIVNGTKKWVSNISGWDGKGADLTTLVCRTPTGADSESMSVLAVRGPVDGLVVHPAPELLGYRAHLTPTVTYVDTPVLAADLVGERGQGRQIVGVSFLPSVALVGAFALGLMRSAYRASLEFASTESRGGPHPIIDYPTVGFALGDAKTTIEAVSALTSRACRALDADTPEARELALHAKIFGSEAAVRTIASLLSVVGVSGYSHDLPLAGLLQDAVALPVFGGSNDGVRRRQLHDLLRTTESR